MATIVRNVAGTCILGIFAFSSFGLEASTGTVQPVVENETTIHKTDLHWPSKALMTIEPCKLRPCHTV